MSLTNLSTLLQPQTCVAKMWTPRPFQLILHTNVTHSQHTHTANHNLDRCILKSKLIML